jgi:hypothetical protein
VTSRGRGVVARSALAARLGDGAPQASPVRISSTSEAVTNAQGLLDPTKGPATLSYTGTGPAPTIVLDYGREVGGLPFFNVGAVTPGAGATSVTLRSAYSEAREFLWTYGNTTLSVPAVAGDTNIKVGSVANFVVGGTLKVDDETATIAAIGTQSRSTTLFSSASAGNANVKVPLARRTRVACSSSRKRSTSVVLPMPASPWPKRHACSGFATAGNSRQHPAR